MSYQNQLMETEFDIAFNHVQEEQEQIELEVKGQIPKWIQGSFYRNGPGLLRSSSHSFKHWFDGLAMLHKFDILDGKVLYQSKYIESNVKESIIENKGIGFPEFATDPCISIFKKLMSSFTFCNPKVNIQEIENHLFALGETRLQLEIDKKSLDSLEVIDYTDTSFSPVVTTAHPHVKDDNLYNLVLSMGPLNFYKIIRYNIHDKTTETIARIPIQQPAYIHSIGMSDSYFIIAHYPYTSNTIDFLLKNKPFIENFKWRKNQKVKFFIVSKKSGKVVHKIKADPFFAFHFINTYEEDDSLIFDMVAYPDAEIINSFYLDNLSNFNAKLKESGLYRFIFNLKSKTLEKREISRETLELPRIDDRYLRKKYNHTYAVGVSKDGNKQFYDQLIKINMCNGKTTIWKDPDYYPGEPIFLHNHDSIDDDNGIIISILINITNKSKGSKLLFLDAKTFTEIASVDIKHSIMPGFHGCFTN